MPSVSDAESVPVIPYSPRWVLRSVVSLSVDRRLFSDLIFLQYSTCIELFSDGTDNDVMLDRSCPHLVPAGEVAVEAEALPDPAWRLTAAVAVAPAEADPLLHPYGRQLHLGPARIGWHL